MPKVEHPNLMKLSEKFKICGIAKKDNDIKIYEFQKNLETHIQQLV